MKTHLFINHQSDNDFSTSPYSLKSNSYKPFKTKKMNFRRILVIMFVCLCVKQVAAQGLRLNAYTGYVFDDKVNSYYSATSYYDGQIKGGFRWGGGLEYMLENVGIELCYLRQDTKASLNYWDVIQRHGDFDLGANWLLLGANGYKKTANGKFEPYGGGKLGVCFFDVKNPNNGNSGNGTKFAWMLQLGSNIWFNESIGLKVQADLISAVQSVGGSVYFGTGGGGAGVASYSTMLQFGLGGGLVFRFAKK